MTLQPECFMAGNPHRCVGGGDADAGVNYAVNDTSNDDDDDDYGSED